MSDRDFNDEDWSAVPSTSAAARDGPLRVVSPDLLFCDELQPLLIEDDYDIPCHEGPTSLAVINLMQHLKEDLELPTVIESTGIDTDFLDFCDDEEFSGMINEFDDTFSRQLASELDFPQLLAQNKETEISVQKSANEGGVRMGKAKLCADRNVIPVRKMSEVRVQSNPVEHQRVVRKVGRSHEEFLSASTAQIVVKKPKFNSSTRHVDASSSGSVLNPKILRLRAPRQMVVRQAVPDDEKDANYYEHRKKNTEAARKCREKRRALDEVRVALLKKQQAVIVELKEKVARLEGEVQFYKDFTRNLNGKLQRNNLPAKRGGTRK